MPVWNPWRGCHRYSEGCKYCYIHKGDAKRGVDTNIIQKTDKFYAPVELNKKGEYKVKPGSLVYLCFSSDFLLEEADVWRTECWEMIHKRSDLIFMFLTKRIERFESCMPKDWGEGYDNVIIGCTVENSDTAAVRLPIFDRLPIKHKDIICQPLISAIDLSGHLDGVEYVTVGGESDKDGRVLDYNWVLDIRRQCEEKHVTFNFRQCGTNFLKDGVLYHLNIRQLSSQAKKAGIDLVY